MRRDVVGSFLLVTFVWGYAPAVAEESGGDIEQRVRESIRAGTGGRTAAHALCQIQALIDFKDGHLTPELIPDWQRFERWALDPDSGNRGDGYTDAGRKLVEKARGEIVRLVEEFREESRRLAMLQDRDRFEWRRQSSRLSNDASAKSEALAGELLQLLRSELTPEDYETLQINLATFAETMVVSRFDHTKLDLAKVCR